MFIGEAPGRQGGDRTRVPFTGDQSGRNFERFLASINLTRRSIFITNAVLCNPRTSSGANRKPTQREVSNCSAFLRRQIEVINPRVIVTLGAVSLAALRLVEYHHLSLREAVGQVHELEDLGRVDALDERSRRKGGLQGKEAAAQVDVRV